ncbi:hypothetical protein FACS1894151_05590 [Spirochaetia bacterium]|nr:hypothetical protein FACS1894151_05590 [Spirochaetia bacterium]
MKKDLFISLVLVTALSFWVLSCASSPPEEQPLEKEAPAEQSEAEAQNPGSEPLDQASLDRFNSAKSRLEEARARAEYFDGPLYSSDNWNTAEALYAGVRSVSPAALSELDETVAKMNTLAGTYDEIFGVALPFYAQARIDEITDSRDLVVGLGVDELWPDLLETADGLADHAWEQYLAEDYYAAAESAHQVFAAYNALGLGTGAWLTRANAISNGFLEVWPERLDLIDTIGSEALDQYDAADYVSAEKNAFTVSIAYEAASIGINAYNIREAAVGGGILDVSPERLDAVDRYGDLAVNNFDAGDYQAAAEMALTATVGYQACVQGIAAYQLWLTVTDTNVLDVFPAQLDLAEITGLEALDLFDGGRFDDAVNGAQAAYSYLDILKTGTDAYKVRQDIVDQDFVRFDESNFDRADEAGLAALGAYDNDNIAAQDYADEALLRYHLAFATGWASYSGERRRFAADERQNALNQKANIAVRSDYDKVSAIYIEAESAYQSGRYEEAAELYFNAEYQFVLVQAAAVEKRIRAEDAIRAAEEQIAASDETARNAEILLEGGTR